MNTNNFSEPSQVADIAQAVQEKLDGYKADKRDLGSVSVLVTVSSSHYYTVGT